MAEDRRPIIVAVGQVGVEFYGVAPRVAPDPRPIELAEISVQVGGTAAVAAAAAAAFGCGARLACRLADDFIGNFALRSLREAGIDTRGAIAADSTLSQLSVDIADQSGDSRMNFFTRGDTGDLEREDLEPEALLEGVDALLLDGSSPVAQLKIADAARAMGIPVILDGASLTEGMGNLIGASSVAICSERLAREVTAAPTLRETLLEVQQLGPKAVIVTIGENGSVGLFGDQLVEQSAEKVDVVDPSGAGSIYHGVFAAAMLSELPFPRCMQFASTAASLGCRLRGAWGSIPERSEVEATVQSPMSIG